VRTVAVHAAGAAAADFAYALDGSPCETILGGGVCAYPSGVAQLFPRDRALADKCIEAYVGAPLVDSRGNPMGLLAVLFKRPLEDPGHVESLLRIFATRAAGELERRGQLIALEHMAHHDSLTRLANREFLRKRMAEALSAGREGTLLLIDLDRFKEINDTLGHAVGDVLLGHLGERLASRADPGTLVARLGGDEFAIWRDGTLEPAAART
jgi:GAF domain-containing protein